MSAVATDMGPAAERQAEKKWRRRSLAALVILLPLALAETSHDSLREWLGGEDLIARDVEFGQSAHFGGSDWKLADLRGGKAGRLPDQAFAVIATFSVTVGDPDLQKQWPGCKLMLTDAAGRRWLPDVISGVRRPDGVMNCTSAIFSGAKTGDVITIGDTFIVPEDAIKTIRPAIGLGSGRPWYLRFQRPPK
ncbi:MULTISPECIES: hypothetical protein [unclassified Mesorhizobium]|uniref:hypothetical protein n=1 Tax=unclassified Mesorhizobium TaxID=325217 RepID=UPI00112A2082|nr:MULTISPECIES: hypothetical protein [unclassified Mesorhizobium]MBZ9983138.1 hypothetical protein [Mesorhizobium sp. BR-1-1-8]TPL32578.1 hypothetical protein FJ947_21335 [Mesorhizobium sp. B2-4-8]TPL62080.1 hypothetical protein FJ949_22085 [Mesorhizobium sp. B2-4-1]